MVDSHAVSVKHIPNNNLARQIECDRLYWWVPKCRPRMDENLKVGVITYWTMTRGRWLARGKFSRSATFDSWIGGRVRTCHVGSLYFLVVSCLLYQVVLSGAQLGGQVVGLTLVYHRLFFTSSQKYRHTLLWLHTQLHIVSLARAGGVLSTWPDRKLKFDSSILLTE